MAAAWAEKGVGIRCGRQAGYEQVEHILCRAHISCLWRRPQEGWDTGAWDQGAVQQCEPLRTVSQTRAQAGTYGYSTLHMLLTPDVRLNFSRLAMAAMCTRACPNGMAQSMGLAIGVITG